MNGDYQPVERAAVSNNSASDELTRPIVGIENRSAAEVFDIMCDRIKHQARRAANTAVGVDEDDVISLIRQHLGASGLRALTHDHGPYEITRLNHGVMDLVRALYTRPASPASAEVTERKGIYVASKVAHAEMWRDFRNFEQLPIISTWIDELYPKDLAGLWERCIREASSAGALIFYAMPGETFKGAWVELGAALSSGVPVFAVGLDKIDGLTIAHDKRITHCENLIEARRGALAALSTQGREAE